MGISAYLKRRNDRPPLLHISHAALQGLRAVPLQPAQARNKQRALRGSGFDARSVGRLVVGHGPEEVHQSHGLRGIALRVTQRGAERNTKKVRYGFGVTLRPMLYVYDTGIISTSIFYFPTHTIYSLEELYIPSMPHFRGGEMKVEADEQSHGLRVKTHTQTQNERYL